MKLRTDFVTNSSSSSFVLTLRFELNQGETIEWSGASDCGEGAYEYVQLSARKSPEELGNANSVDELAEMLKESVGQGILDYDEAFEPIFDDDSAFIAQVKQIPSMDAIAKITIEGYEDTFRDWDDGPEARDDVVTYDMKSKQQTAVVMGTSYIESEGTGGALDFEHRSAKKEAPEGYFDAKRESFSSMYEEEYDE